VLADAPPTDIVHSPAMDALAQVEGDVVLVEAGDIIPTDGEVIEGVASVDESAITGESAPVIREAAATAPPSPAARRVVSDWLVVRSPQSRRDLPRPHDRARRRRQAPEDAERDRARHPARRLTLIFLFAS
jgi:magnesium-transporting ATPase (P-type)